MSKRDRANRVPVKLDLSRVPPPTLRDLVEELHLTFGTTDTAELCTRLRLLRAATRHAGGEGHP